MSLQGTGDLKPHVVVSSLVYTHAVEEGTSLEVHALSPEMFVIVCKVNGKTGKMAIVEHCQRCAWATCHRISSSGKWKELAPEDET